MIDNRHGASSILVRVELLNKDRVRVMLVASLIWVYVEMTGSKIYQRRAIGL